MEDEAKPRNPINATFEALVVQLAQKLGPVNQCQLKALKFSTVIDLLSILLRYSGFTTIQKLVLNQTVSRPPNNHQTLTETFFWVEVWPWEVLWSFFSVQPWSWSSPVVI